MNIEKALRVLNEMMDSGVVEAYALGWAVAATYFLEPISTADIDVFVRLRPEPGKTVIDPAPIFAFLSARGYETEGEYALIEGWPVQFLAHPGPLGDEALADALMADADGTPVRLLRAEHLAAIALATGRAKDKARVLMFLESPAFGRSAFEAIVSRHGLDDRWARFRREFGVEL